MVRKIYKRGLVGIKWVILLSALFYVSCSQTKFVAEQDYLIQKVAIEIDTPEVDKEEAKSFVRQKENYKILGFLKFYLLIYNLSSKKKTDDWLKRIGEAPQIYDELMVERSKEQLTQYMDYKGFYRANVSSEVAFNDKKQKAQIQFNVVSGDRYTIRKINYHFVKPELKNIFFSNAADQYILAGHAFDYYELEKQRAKIVTLYKNNGYFYFTNNQVRFLADTMVYEKQVLLDLFIGETTNSQQDSSKILSPYYVNNFYYSILPGSTPVTLNQGGGEMFSDTVVWENSQLYLNKVISYPPELLDRTNQMKSGDLYQISEVENTFNGFNRLRQFRFVDIQFSETLPQQDTNLLDCNIRLAPLSKQSTSFDIEGSNTSGNAGIAGNIYYQHRNLFKGAEIFQLRFKGAVERIRRNASDGNSDVFMAREFGAESSLIIPKLLGPGKYIRSFERNLPKTVLNIGYNYQRRPDYTRTISNFKYGYDWKSSQNLQHVWNLLDFNIVKLFEYDPDFMESIEDLYIKTSFTDHLIFAMNYSVIFNNQRLNATRNYKYLRLNVESAGNLLWILSELSRKEMVQAIDTVTGETYEYYEVLNTQFAQYLKADVEVRKAFEIDKINWIVARGFLGVGLPYGNFKVLPYEKQYFAGGANGIRAWQVRDLGPGTYKAEEDAYPNQSADIKIEANLEYRFKLLGAMEGALFLDAGNIWAISRYDNREGALFKFNQFYKEFAIGTGTGLRFDLNYFVFRTDLGMKLRDPSEEPGQRWIIGNRSYAVEDFAFSFAIGYPF